MAEFEMTPDIVKEETLNFTDEVADELAEVQAAAAAISETPIIDLEAEQKPTVNALARSTSQTAMPCSATEQAHSAKFRILRTVHCRA